MRLPPLKWPNDAKIAVSFFVAFEAFEKSSQYRRQEGDKPDYASLAYGEYGGRAGIYRMRISVAGPNIIGVFEECIRYTKGFKDVWFATKGEIARYYLDTYGQTR